MKKMLKFSVLLLAATLIFGLAGCGDGNGDDDKGKKNNNSSNNNNSGVDFTSATPPSIFVDNASNQKLVAFKGSLNPNYLIGGIPAYAVAHGLPKKPTLFSQTGDFALIVITEDEYNSKKSNLASATVFAEIYAFYNHEATNNNSFRISGLAGGTGQINLNNPTGWNVEIRNGGPTDNDVLGYVAAQNHTTLRVDAPSQKAYTLYPVFKKYNPIEKEIWPVFPKYQTGEFAGYAYAKSIAMPAATTVVDWNLNEVLSYLGAGGTMNMTTGSVYLKIINNNKQAMQLQRGDEVLFTEAGIRPIPPSNSNNYFIKIQREVDGKYPVSQLISGLKIGIDQGLSKVIPDYTFKLDYKYTITLSGNDISDLVIGAIEEGEAIDVDKLFGGN